MKRLLLCLPTLFLLAVPGASAGADTVHVIVGDNYYDPGILTVAPGTTVHWMHQGGLPHTITADDGSFDSHPACSGGQGACMQSGDTFERAFNTLGTIAYFCKVHGAAGGVGMAGVVRVVDPATIPTTVTSLSAAVIGTTISVSGMAEFGGQAPVTVSEDPAGDAPLVADLGDETGVDLVAARLSVPDPNKPELLVEWQVTALPETGSLPEGVRYSLPFKIGTKEFQVQAKFSNLASITTTDDPSGHVTHVGATFQLRGNCTTNWNGTNVAYCYHLGWLTGEFDTAKDAVRVRVPLGSAMAPEIAPGVMLQRNTSSNANLNKVISGYQAFVALSPTTNDEAFFGPEEVEGYAFEVASKKVSLGIAPAGTPPTSVNFSTAATVGAGDSFSGTVSTAGLPAGSYDVFAKACFAENCGVRSFRITI